MSELTDHPPVDRSGWDPGPWDDEPDRLEWEHAGRPCLMVRQETQGHWCGYAAVDPGHPMHGKHYHDVEVEVDVHGGLTYADACAGHVCHVPQPGKPDDVWWFGFDCCHAFDVAPGLSARLREVGAGDLFKNPRDGLPEYSYKTVPYVQAEVNRLAEFLAEVP